MTTLITQNLYLNMSLFSKGLHDAYKPFHGYFSLVVCLFGTLANIVNIAVLTRKEMNGSPINRILTGNYSKSYN